MWDDLDYTLMQFQNWQSQQMNTWDAQLEEDPRSDPNFMIESFWGWQLVRDALDGIYGYWISNGNDVDGDGDIDLRDAANYLRRESLNAERENETNPNLVNYLESQYGPLGDSALGTLADLIDWSQPWD